MDIHANLARNLRHYRTQLGMSQEDLADKAGLDRTYISGIERAIRNPTLSALAKLADAVSVSVVDLLR